MSFFRSGNQQTTTPSYSGVQVQTASSAIPMPIVLGVGKVAPNIIWNNGFYGQPTSGKGSKGGGKGGVLGKGQNPETYYSAIMLGVCEGPATAVRSVFDNSTITDLASCTTMSGQGFITGTVPNSPWSVLENEYSSQLLQYPGLAMVVAAQINLGESATLDSYSFEVEGPLAFTGYNGYDADPAQCVLQLLTNEQWGLGFPSDSIDMSTLIGSSGDASYQSYCKAQGLAFSPVMTDQESATSILERWLQITNTAAVWSGGQLKFIPYGDSALTGTIYSYPSNSAYNFGTNNASQSYAFSPYSANPTGTWSYTPDVTPIYNLTDDDFISDGDDDPVQVTRIDPWTMPNYLDIEIYQRSNFYDATPITVFDQAAIEAYGQRVAPTVTAHEICDPGVAQTSAQLILQRQLYIRRGYKFKLSWEYCLLEPMDIVTLTDPLVGLNNTPVRITDIDEDDQGLLSFTAEEFPNGVATAVEYPVQVKSSNGIAASAPAPAINAPLIFEPPYQLAGELAVWIALCPVQNGQSWGGCNVYLSVDNDSFVQIGEAVGSSVMGALTAALPAVIANSSGAAVLDGVDEIEVSLTESGGSLSSVSSQAMASGASAAFVGIPPTGEIVSYQNADLTAAEQYTLSPLMRGLFGSEIEAHANGEFFASLAGPIFKQAYQPDQIGQTLYFKFQSFNTLGGGLQPIEDCATYSYTLTGLGLAGPVAIPQNLRLAFSDQFAELTWDTITDSRGPVTYVIKQGPTAATAQTVGQTVLPPYAITTPGTYWVFATVTPIVGITLSSAASSSQTLTQNMLVENLLQEIDEQSDGWQGTLVNLEISGTAPAQQLVLKDVPSVDFGTTDASDPVATTDDFGSTSDNVVTPLDLGTV